MNALSARDFKSPTQELWHKVARTGTVTLTVDLAKENMDDLQEVFQRLKTMQAVHRMRAAAAARPTPTAVEIDAEVEAAVLSGKTRRAPEIEVMRTRLAAMESIIANFGKDLNALAASQSPRRQPVPA